MAGVRLRDLKPFLVRYCVENGRVLHRIVETVAECQGIRFTCPACRTHQIVCWSESRGVPADANPGPGRWRIDGATIDDLSLNEDGNRTRSVDSGCWHGFVTNGEVTTC